MTRVSSEILAAFELERLMHRAAASRFERTRSGFVCANPDLASVWDASRVQVEPDGEMPDLSELAALAELPSQWHPGLRHRTVFMAPVDEGRELAYSLARGGWEIRELALMICRRPPRVPAAAERVEGPQMRRLKGRLGVEHGLPPNSAAEFDRYDDLRARAAAHFAFGSFVEGRAVSFASMYLRGDIAALEDVATLTRLRGRGHGRVAVLGATAAALRLTARAVYLFAEPQVAEGFYEPMGFERIGGAWSCQKPPA